MCLGSIVCMTVCVMRASGLNVYETYVLVVGSGMGVGMSWFWPLYPSGPGMDV